VITQTSQTISHELPLRAATLRQQHETPVGCELLLLRLLDLIFALYRLPLRGLPDYKHLVHIEFTKQTEHRLRNDFSITPQPLNMSVEIDPQELAFQRRLNC
jgi:hypothetical protein